MFIEEATTNLLRVAAKLYDENSQEKTIGIYKALEEILNRLEHLRTNSRVFESKQEYKKARLCSFVAMCPSAKLIPELINTQFAYWNAIGPPSQI